MTTAARKSCPPIGTIALVLWLLILAMLAGCGSVRDEKAVTREHVSLKIPHVIVETPVGPVTIKPVEVRQDRTETTDTHAESTPTAPPIPPIVSDAGGSLLSLVPGVGGLLAAAWAFVGRQRAVGALQSVVQGIEEFKAESADGHTVEKLEATLSRKMDRSHKRVVKQIKG